MPEEANSNQKPNFHEFALNSGLFKGRPDFYFSYLKAERLSHALVKLARSGDGVTSDVFENLVRASTMFPGALARFSAGEIEEAGILADLFEILSLIRLSVSQELLAEGNARVLVEEYEGIGQKIDMGKHASPFIALEDLAVPPLGMESGTSKAPLLSPPRSETRGKVKDIRIESKGHSGRALQILEFIRKHKRVTIKEIASVVRGVSEKTIQRELLTLIQGGLIRKEGERRWSQYLPL